MIKVLIAEDSVTTRELLVGILGSDPNIEIVGVAKNGREAVEMTKRLKPDVVTMDINMPELNGFEATKQIMIESPTPIVIISGDVNINDVTVSMNALRVGATTLLEKPPSVNAPDFNAAVHRIVTTVKAMASVKVVRHRPERVLRQVHGSGNMRSVAPQIIALASSTGGPAALARILSDLPPGFPLPILIVQHIAHGFVQGLATWLNSSSALQVRVAKDGEPLASSTVYLAGDGFHLGVGPNARVRLDASDPIAGFRPSANYLFESVARIYGAATLAGILTGMGQDGVEGLQFVKTAGGLVVAQDEASCVVFGMPHAAISKGLADEVLPVSAIGEWLASVVSGEALRNGGLSRGTHTRR